MLSPPIGQWLVKLLDLLDLLATGVVIVGETELALRDVDELLALVFGKMLESELVDGVVQKEHLVTLFEEGLKDWRLHEGLLVVAGNEVDVILTGLGTADVFIETGNLGDVSGGEPSKKGENR